MKTYNKRFVYFICLVSAMGGLLFGYDWVVIGGAKPFYELYFDIADNPSMQGLAMSIALLGCLVGAMVSGMMADRYGRKPLLLVSALIFFFSAYATGAFSSFIWFLVARFWGGIGIGIASGLSPMYIAEVAPTAIRGRLVSLNQLTIVLGILCFVERADGMEMDVLGSCFPCCNIYPVVLFYSRKSKMAGYEGKK